MVKDCLTLVKRELRRDISQLQEQYQRLSQNYSLPTKTNIWKDLHQQSLKHSLEIELHGLSGSELTRERRKCLGYLTDAFRFGINEYGGVLTSDLVLDLAQRVEPRTNLYGYRNSSCRLRKLGNGGYYLPPDPADISSEMDLFLLENSFIQDPLEKAGHAHIHLARIHPFNDGNGRLSRLVQNIVLQSGGFFPLILRSDQRKQYIQLISSAVNSYEMAIADLSGVPEYEELRSLVSSGNSSDNPHYVRRLLNHLAFRKFTPEINRFCNFLLEKEKETISLECNRIISQSSK